jgi:uncharacterized membrane protein
MIGPRHCPIPLAAALALAACHGGSAAPSSTTVTAADTQPYDGIPAGEAVHFTGTEPFWSGQVSGGVVTYVTPEDQAGQTIAVDRFAGRNGVSFSGQLAAMPFVLAVTPGQCSDGMSDRKYPFTVTLQVNAEQRKGCAWTDRQPFTGPRQP